MVCRGELGFLMASQASLAGILSGRAFRASVWALFLATLSSPFFFRCLISRLDVGDLGVQELDADQGVEEVDSTNREGHQNDAGQV